MIKSPIPNETAALNGGANFEVLVTHEDLTMATATTAQTIPLFNIPAKASVELVRAILDETFEDTADAASILATMIVGDSGSTNRFLTSTETNKNGAFVPLKNGTGTSNVYTAATTVDLVVAAPTAGKNLAAFNRGRIRFLFKVIDARPVTPAP